MKLVSEVGGPAVIKAAPPPTDAGGLRVTDEKSDGLLKDTVTTATNATTDEVLVTLKTPA
jgi:hypothetical protein